MSEFYRVQEIKKNIYRIDSDEQVFMDLFVGTDKALLYDTGYGLGNLEETVKKITGLPLIVVNSHGHMDHTGGNYQFKEMCLLHESEMEICKNHNSKDMRKNTIEISKKTFDYISGEMKNIIPEDFSDENYINGGYGNVAFIKEDEVFNLGGITLETVLLPGHTPGGIGLLYKEEKMLYVGDALNPFLWLFGPEALKLKDYIDTIKKAQGIDFDSFVMGHVPTVADKKMLDDFLDCALNIDFESGTPFESPLVKDADARICTRKGYGPMEMFKPGYASIVISKEHL